MLNTISPRRVISSLILSSALLGATALSPSAQAQGVPTVMPYQGFLSDGAGAPVSGSVSVTFKLYEELISNEPVWEESLQNVSVSEGVFAVNLGAATPKPP